MKHNREKHLYYVYTMNEEVHYNSHSEDFIFGLPYSKTKWGEFYSCYKNLGQLQIQKFLEKTWNILMKPKDKMQQRNFVKSIFYDSVNKTTPQILLKEKTHGYADAKWCELHKRQNDILDSVYPVLIHRMSLEYAEVALYYQAQKQNTGPKEITHCEHCKTAITRANKARHERTNQKCFIIRGLSNNGRDKV